MVATMRTNIFSVVNQTAVPEIDDAPDLGTILMTEVRTDIQIAQDDLRLLWNQRNLPPEYLPKVRHHADAFRRAAPRNRPSAKRKGLMLVEYKGPAKEQHDLQVACVLTRSADAADRIAVHHKNRTVVGIDKAGTFVTIDPVVPPDDDELAYVEDVRRQYDILRRSIDGDQIRSGLTRALKDASAVWVHTTTYIVPATQVETARSVAGVLKDLDRYIPQGRSGNRVVVIQYQDTPEQRNQLRDQIQHHVRREIEGKFVEIAAAQKQRGKMGDRAKDTIMADIGQLGLLIAEYEQVLKESLAPVRNYVDMQRLLLQRELDAL